MEVEQLTLIELVELADHGLLEGEPEMALRAIRRRVAEVLYPDDTPDGGDGTPGDDDTRLQIIYPHGMTLRFHDNRAVGGTGNILEGVVAGSPFVMDGYGYIPVRVAGEPGHGGMIIAETWITSSG
jgi:hypothetical protein